SRTALRRERRAPIIFARCCWRSRERNLFRASVKGGITSPLTARSRCASDAEADRVGVVVGGVELEVGGFGVDLAVLPRGPAHAPVAQHGEVGRPLRPFLDVARLIERAVVARRIRIGADVRGLMPGFATGVGGVTGTRRRFRNRHIVAARWEEPIITRFATVLERLMI